MKRIFKGPWLWSLLAVVGVLLALQFFVATDEYDEISTSKMNDYIASGEVSEIKFIDGDQKIEATLDDGVEREGGLKVMAYWLSETQDEIEQAVAQKVDDGEIEDYTTEVAQPSVLGSILSMLLPLLIIIVVFLWLMNSMQGGGGRGIMQFAKSKAKLITKDMPLGIFAPTAWNLAGSCRNSLISPSSSIASSHPATSVKVSGMSLVISFALDLANCMMPRPPPPCMLFINQRKTTMMISSGSSMLRMEPRRWAAPPRSCSSRSRRCRPALRPPARSRPGSR